MSEWNSSTMKSEDKSKLCTKHVGCGECCCNLQNRFAIKHISALFFVSYLLLTTIVMAFCLGIYHNQHNFNTRNERSDIKNNNFYGNAPKNTG